MSSIASESRILWSIIVPAARAALITVGIYTFISQWNNLFWPLVVATSAPELATLTVELKMLESSFDPNRNAHLILAGLTMGIMPVMAVFASLQKYYVRGITMSGVKE
jgi:multiple sugar transport system permease protein